MSELLKLSQSDRSAAIRALVNMWPSIVYGSELLDIVIDAVNQDRLGDPVGTIRQSTQCDELYLRFENNFGERYWKRYLRGDSVRGDSILGDEDLARETRVIHRSDP